MCTADLALIYQCSNNITASAVYHHRNVGVATNIFYPVTLSTCHWNPGKSPQPLVQVPCPCQDSLQGCLDYLF